MYAEIFANLLSFAPELLVSDEQIHRGAAEDGLKLTLGQLYRRTTQD